MMKDETELLIALVRENVAIVGQSADDYSTSPSLKHTSNKTLSIEPLP